MEHGNKLRVPEEMEEEGVNPLASMVSEIQ